MRPVAAFFGRREKIISGNFDEILAHSCAASCSSEFARWGIWRHVAATGSARSLSKLGSREPL
jgi:hypothetical protein